MAGGVRCWRCGLMDWDPNNLADGWCDFCRMFHDDRSRTTMRVWQLDPDDLVRRVPAALLGDRTHSGRRAIRYTLVRMRHQAQAALVTEFVAVDPCQIGQPLLFATYLADLDTGLTFDAFGRRYGSRAAAERGHEAHVARLAVVGATILTGWQ